MEPGVSRRIYTACLAAVSIALILLRLFAIPQWDGTDTRAVDLLAPVTDSLLGAALAALAISAVIFWLYGTESHEIEEAIVVEPKQISRELKDAAESTSEWNYRGHTGRYFRSTILPVLERRAESHGRYINISAQLLDPDDLGRLQYFVEYRASVNPEKAAYWTVDRARAEILATVISVATAPQRSKRISCQIFLGGFVSPFTVDMATSVAVVTRESSSMGALKYPAGSTFFDSMVEDLHIGRSQAKELDTTRVCNVESASADDVRAVLNHLAISAEMDGDMMNMILSSLHHPVNPYPGG